MAANWWIDDLVVRDSAGTPGQPGNPQTFAMGRTARETVNIAAPTGFGTVTAATARLERFDADRVMTAITGPIEAVGVVGGNSADVTLTGDPASGTDLAAGEVYRLTVRFVNAAGRATEVWVPVLVS